MNRLREKLSFFAEKWPETVQKWEKTFRKLFFMQFGHITKKRYKNGRKRVQIYQTERLTQREKNYTILLENAMNFASKTGRMNRK